MHGFVPLVHPKREPMPNAAVAQLQSARLPATAVLIASIDQSAGHRAGARLLLSCTAQNPLECLVSSWAAAAQGSAGTTQWSIWAACFIAERLLFEPSCQHSLQAAQGL